MDLKSNGGRKPVHIVRRAERQQPGAAFDPERDAAPGTAYGGLKRHVPAQRVTVTLAEIPSLDGGAMSLEDGYYAHKIARAREAGEEAQLTREQEGALVRAFGLRRRT